MPRHTQFLLGQLGEGGGYVIILPLLPNNCKATLQPARWGTWMTLLQYCLVLQLLVWCQGYWQSGC
jgi:hypothetical protein